MQNLCTGCSGCYCIDCMVFPDIDIDESNVRHGVCNKCIIPKEYKRVKYTCSLCKIEYDILLMRFRMNSHFRVKDYTSGICVFCAKGPYPRYVG